LNIHDINDVKTEMHLSEPLVPELSSSEIEIAVEKLNHQVLIKLIELVQAGGNTLHSEIHRHINSIWSKEELPKQWKESYYCTYL
jgi:hypothetical protein